MKHIGDIAASAHTPGMSGGNALLIKDVKRALSARMIRRFAAQGKGEGR